jgi:REP element-mobilizing transposase RayT
MPARFRISRRLKDYDYLGRLAAHVVVVTRQRLPLFEDSNLASICEEALKEACTAFDATLDAWCLCRTMSTSWWRSI